MLKTNIPDHIRKASSEEAVSVIHAPEGFQQWVCPTRTLSARDVAEKLMAWQTSTDTTQVAAKPDDIISPPESEPSAKVRRNSP